ncbi:unnamed protein product [Meganyctiphanes norvegica]|uniref:Plexus n=1 Tax=Meganyctiphanes norvegica TaxID=48144 RepID=A0AAV2QI05_MEGNR
MKQVYGRSDGGGGDIKLPSCYVCGCPRTGQYPLAIRQQPSGSYFPFLETHEPPDRSETPSATGHVLSCFLCFSYLNQQWELYERDKVPPVKRIYWLKRIDNGPYTGVEVGVQSEYASQLLGLAPDASDSKRPPAGAGPVAGPSSSRLAPPPLPPPVAAPSLAVHSSRMPGIDIKRSRLHPPQPQAPTAMTLPPRGMVPPQPQPPNAMSLPPPGVVPPLPLAHSITHMVPQQEALDLSVDSRRGTKRSLEEEANSARELPKSSSMSGSSRPEVLDLSMPDKNATTEVCYICGDHHKKGTLVDIYATQQSGSVPFYSSLTQHSRPSKSHPMEASGRVQGCRDCYNHLLVQWEANEALKIPHSERNYSLRKRRSIQDASSFICFKCGLAFPSSSLRMMYSKPNTENEPYYPFLQTLEPPDGASPISPQGVVQVCGVCNRNIPREHKSLLLKKTTQSAVDLNKKSSPEPSVMSEMAVSGHKSRSASPAIVGPPVTSPHVILAQTAGDADAAIPRMGEETSCYMCHQVHSGQMMHWIAMVPERAGEDKMYFSFLKFLPRNIVNTVIKEGRVQVCPLCYLHISSQWADYDKENVPINQRHFSLRNITSSTHSPRLTPISSLTNPSGNENESPPPILNSPVGEAASALSDMYKNTTSLGYQGQPLHTLEVVPAHLDTKTPTLPVISKQRALNIAIDCFVCGTHSKPGQTYAIKSETKVPNEPFYPFLAKHVSAHPEARVDESTVLACLCCFHSLFIQWQRYERSQVDHYARLYDNYNFTCYVCTGKTYRKRLYLLPIKDYPFLLDHQRPSGGMVVENGRSVVVCKDCYSSLKSQYIELEKWGLPVDKRQYNWIQRPPPPRFQPESSSTGAAAGASPTGSTITNNNNTSPMTTTSTVASWATTMANMSPGGQSTTGVVVLGTSTAVGGNMGSNHLGVSKSSVVQQLHGLSIVRSSSAGGNNSSSSSPAAAAVSCTTGSPDIVARM